MVYLYKGPDRRLLTNVRAKNDLYDGGKQSASRGYTQRHKVLSFNITMRMLTNSGTDRHEEQGE
jgi:hypothetical protein